MSNFPNTAHNQIRSSHKPFITGIIFLILVAFVSAISESLYISDNNNVLLVYKFTTYSIMLFFLYVIFEKITKWNFLFSQQKMNYFLSRLTANRYLIISIYFFVYLIHAILFFPGVCGWDTINQVMDLISKNAPLPFGWINGQPTVSALMNDHHPVFDTLIFTLFYWIGKKIGDPNIGLFLYNTAQITLLSCLFAEVIVGLSEFRSSLCVRVLCFVFYIMPFINFFSITIIKDTLFSFVFVLYFRTFISVFIALRKGKTIQNKEWLILFITSLLIALTNKKGIYIAISSAFSLIIISRSKKYKKTVILKHIIPVIVIICSVRFVLFPALNIYPGGRQESLGFSFQQIAAAYIDHPEDFSKNDIMTLNNVLTIEPIQYESVYQERSTELIKNNYNFYASDRDIWEYLKLWGKIGMKHPISYLRTTMKVNAGYFYPGKSINIYTGIPENNSLSISQKPETKNMRFTFQACFDWIKEKAGISLLYKDAFYIFWVPSLIICMLLKKGKKDSILCLTPVVMNYFFLIIGPICWTRYGLGQIYTIPLQISLVYRMD